MSTRIIQVDSFTDRPFAGNPAAVCLLDAPAPEPWMQHVAAEMNLSETAFVQPTEPDPCFVSDGSLPGWKSICAVSPRGGVVKVCVEGPRVVLIGQAVTVLRGELLD